MTRVDGPSPDPAVELRLIGLLFERPTTSTRDLARELRRETKDPALRSLAERLECLKEAAYVALFGPGGPVSPREVAYRSREDPGRIMADLSTFYEAFGYRPITEEPIDHVAVETGFVSYLRLKEIYAAGNEETASVTAAARARFTQEHLSTLAAGMAGRLQSVQVPELLELARILQERVGPTALPSSAPSHPDDDEELTCGPCGLPAGI